MEKFLTIGEVSKLFKTTNRQLRFYEEKDLLKPSKVDENSGYRYYSEENCEKLNKILCLKDIGLSLSDISKYFSGDNETKKRILLKYLNIGEQVQYRINQIFRDNDYDLNFVKDIAYVGNDIKKKDLSKLKGVWVLEGIYKDIKNARINKNPIEKTTPYKFLAFDEFGNSPWFYSANEQFVVFDTYWKPVKEIYQVLNGKLYLKIANPNEHLFGKVENPISEKHILVFKNASDKYKDYTNYLYQDEYSNLFELDPKLIGVWKLNSETTQKYLIVNANGTADLSFKAGIKQLKWSKGFFYDEEFKIKLNYQINNKKLFVENKAKMYVFSGITRGYEEFVKI